MNTLQKIIRIFAILLAIAIIAGMCNFIYELVVSFTPINTKVVVKEYDKEFNNIDSLEVNVSAAQLTMTSGDKVSVHAENLPSKIKVKQEGKRLVVKQSSSNFNLNHGEIEITVPKELISVLIKGGAGSMDISGLTVKDFDLEIGAGKTILTNMELSEANIEGGAGSLEITESKITNLDMETGAGRVLFNGYLYGNNKIDCGIGRVDITLRGDEDSYSVRAKKGIGSLAIAGEEYGREVNYGKGKNKLRVEGGVGEISIRFKREKVEREETEEEIPREDKKEESKKEKSTEDNKKDKEDSKKEQN